MEIEKALTEAAVNGAVIGAIVAAVMIFSNQVSNVVILRTTLAAGLFRFGMYMVENVDEVNTGHMGDYFGLPKNKTAQILKNVHFGKVI